MIKLGALPESPFALETLETFRMILPVALLTTNIFSTMVILYKTWLVSVSFLWILILTFNLCRMYRTQIKIYLNTKNKTIERVLILLIESGVVYISIWVGSIRLVSLLEKLLDSRALHYSHKILSGCSGSTRRSHCAIHECMTRSCREFNELKFI